MKWGITIQMNPALAAQAANAGMGILTGAIENEMQFGLQKRLNQEQVKNSKQLQDYQLIKQMEMWQKTGYGAQVKQMNEAGINPGLLYGMSGGGGQTTGNISATAQGGQAGKGTNIEGIMGMGIQQALLQAQKEKLAAEANLANTQANKLKGVDTAESTARTELLQQGLDNERQKYEILKLEQVLKHIENYEKQTTQPNRLEFIEYQTKQAMKHLEIVQNEAFVSSATINEKIAIIAAEALGAAIRNELTKNQIQLTQEQITQIKEHIKQNWIGLDVDKFEAELKQKFPGILNVGGRVINDAIEAVYRIISGKPSGNFGRSVGDK